MRRMKMRTMPTMIQHHDQRMRRGVEHESPRPIEEAMDISRASLLASPIPRIDNDVEWPSISNPVWRWRRGDVMTRSVGEQSSWEPRKSLRRDVGLPRMAIVNAWIRREFRSTPGEARQQLHSRYKSMTMSKHAPWDSPQLQRHDRCVPIRSARERQTRCWFSHSSRHLASLVTV